MFNNINLHVQEYVTMCTFMSVIYLFLKQYPLPGLHKNYFYNDLLKSCVLIVGGQCRVLFIDNFMGRYMIY